MAFFCILKKEKKSTSSTRNYLTNPQRRPVLLLLCHLLLDTMPSTSSLHVFTPSTATSSHGGLILIGKCMKNTKKERKKGRRMILSVLKRTHMLTDADQVLTTALQIRGSSSTEISSGSCHNAMRHRSCISMMNNHWKGDELYKKLLCSVETQLAWTWTRIILLSCVPFFWIERVVRSEDLKKQ